MEVIYVTGFSHCHLNLGHLPSENTLLSMSWRQTAQHRHLGTGLLWNWVRCRPRHPLVCVAIQTSGAGPLLWSPFLPWPGRVDQQTLGSQGGPRPPGGVTGLTPGGFPLKWGEYPPLPELPTCLSPRKWGAHQLWIELHSELETPGHFLSRHWAEDLSCPLPPNKQLARPRPKPNLLFRCLVVTTSCGSPVPGHG